jgi:hypothetical protein
MGVKSAAPYNLISLDSDDDDGVAEVDRFLIKVDEEKEQDSSSMAGSAQHEARKKQKLYGGPGEPSLLDSSLEMDEGTYFTPELMPCPQQLQDMSDIQFGVTNKPLIRDPPYDPVVYDLFHNRDNCWIQSADRLTALEMWDDTYYDDDDDDEFYTCESEYDPY